MDADFILRQVQHMNPSSFSETEQRCYIAEKMLMRQFILLMRQNQVPIYFCTADMKDWLLECRSFLEEFQEIANKVDARRLLQAELVWISARRLCVNQMEQELYEELDKEERLSQHFGRKVTLEGLAMFLAAFHPKTEQVIQRFLRHLSKKLLTSCPSAYISQHSRLALVSKLQRTTAPLVPQLMETTLDLLLNGLESIMEVSQPQGTYSSWTSALRDKAEAASADIGRQLTNAVATCFSPNMPLRHLLQVCTSVSKNLVNTMYKRFLARSKTFHLMDFDESSIIARETVISTIQEMTRRREEYIADLPKRIRRGG